jgi:hypothetical protein
MAFSDCLLNLVTLGSCPEDEESLSGFTLLTAPGISPKILADIANENYISGKELAMQKKNLTLLQVRNDFIGALQTQNVVTNMAVPEFETGEIILANSTGTYEGYRGLKVHKTNRKGGLRKTYIKNIQAYPLSSGVSYLRIVDGDQTSLYQVTWIANQLNTVAVEYEMNNQYVNIEVDQTAISFAETNVTCQTGCGGRTPNDCAWVEGWDGTKNVKSNGYGIKAVFYCKCDYDHIICDIKYFGELIWLKWTLNIMEEQYRTNRFNNWVIYNRDEMPDVINQLRSDYATKWNEMMAGLFGILNTYRDACLDCKGIKKFANI